MEDAFIYIICYTLYFNVHITFGFGLIIYIKTNHHEAAEEVNHEWIISVISKYLCRYSPQHVFPCILQLSLCYCSYSVFYNIIKLILFGRLKHLYITVSVYLLGLLLPSWPDLSWKRRFKCQWDFYTDK